MTSRAPLNRSSVSQVRSAPRTWSTAAPDTGGRLVRAPSVGRCPRRVGACEDDGVRTAGPRGPSSRAARSAARSGQAGRSGSSGWWHPTMAQLTGAGRVGGDRISAASPGGTAGASAGAAGGAPAVGGDRPQLEGVDGGHGRAVVVGQPQRDGVRGGGGDAYAQPGVRRWRGAAPRRRRRAVGRSPGAVGRVVAAEEFFHAGAGRCRAVRGAVRSRRPRRAVPGPGVPRRTSPRRVAMRCAGRGRRARRCSPARTAARTGPPRRPGWPRRVARPWPAVRRRAVA
ncbi:hypothetical protein SANTM175S_09847 [Streptomyces antimycoticus]